LEIPRPRGNIRGALELSRPGKAGEMLLSADLGEAVTHLVWWPTASTWPLPQTPVAYTPQGSADDDAFGNQDFTNDSVDV
jgi:hypothetical protein